MKVTLIFASKAVFKQSTSSTTLKKMLSLSNTATSETKVLEQLFACFNVCQKPGQDLPEAAASAQIDFRQQKKELNEHKVWIRADPVFLQADLTTVLLFDSQHFNISRDEVSELLSLINPLLAEFNLQLICGADLSRWYIALEESPAITSTSPDRIDEQNIQQFLPQGKERSIWLRMGNEIQMLLHNAELNQQRLARGEAPINGVWFWGAGRLPDQASLMSDSTFSHVFSDDVIAQGLARWANLPVYSIPVDLEEWLLQHNSEQHALLVLSAEDFNSFDQEGIELRFFQPLLRQMKKGNLKSLELITDELNFMLKPSHLLRFWRR